MLIKILVKDTMSDRTWPETYNTHECKLTSGMEDGLSPLEYAEAIVAFWNGTLRPHETAREVLDAREINEDTFKLAERIGYEEDAPEPEVIEIEGDVWGKC
jgi:hypothetical protein